jgi:hypothetical protein
MLPVGYSSNLHAAESVADLVRVIGGFTAEVRRRLGWPRLGLDLRLGSVAIAELRADEAARATLRRALDRAGASAHTLNAFPLRPFQEAVVKTNVYLPDWTEAERENDTVALIPIALALSNEPVVTISTLPGSFRPFGPERNDAGLIATALGRWAGVAANAQRDTGRRVILCLEPEPWCFLENSQDVAGFWHGPLLRDGLVACAGLLGGDEPAARVALTQHLGICFDTCHFSLAFEDQAAAVARLQAAGATVAKCQFSAAPEVRDPRGDPAGLAALRALAEPRFLHQTAAVDDAGTLSQVQDLDQLDACLARLPSATAVRSHFHIPVFRPAVARGLSSTIDDSLRGLKACLATGCAHLAVETYTWSILAEHECDALDGTVKELAFTAAAVEQASRGQENRPVGG